MSEPAARRYVPVLISATLQFAAVFGGMAWGWAEREYRGVLIPWSWGRFGLLSVTLMALGQFEAAWNSRRRSARRRADHQEISAPSAVSTEFFLSALASAAICLILSEAFLFINWGPVPAGIFLFWVFLLMPFILAISVLVRRRIWLAVAGAVLFLTTSIAMITFNGMSLWEGRGFFAGWAA